MSGYFKDQTLKKLTLPTNVKYWVEILTDLRYGDIKKFATASQEGQVDFATNADIFLQTVVKNWNLDDDQGHVLEITAANLDRLEKDDVLAIINEAGGLVESEAEKKSSPSLSTPRLAETPLTNRQ